MYCPSSKLKVLRNQEGENKSWESIDELNNTEASIKSEGSVRSCKTFQLHWSATHLLCLLPVAFFSWQRPHWLTHQPGQLCFARDNVLIKGLQYLIKIRCRCFYRGRSNEGRAASRWEVEGLMGLILHPRRGPPACRDPEFAEGNVWLAASSQGLKVSSGEPVWAESPGVSITSGRCETDLNVCMQQLKNNYWGVGEGGGGIHLYFKWEQTKKLFSSEVIVAHWYGQRLAGVQTEGQKEESG